MIIQEAKDADLQDVLFIEREAFKSDTEAELTRDMLADPSAKPLLSLLAFVEDRAVGYILFTRGVLLGKPKVKVSILAPLAVLPSYQKQGIGGKLIKQGLDLLSQQRVALVFVAGHPQYYPEYGFTPAYKLGFEPPYPLPKKVADAWMVQALRQHILGSVSGRVLCCEVLNKPEYWREE
jgi:putative acetyltransferase